MINLIGPNYVKKLIKGLIKNKKIRVLYFVSVRNSTEQSNEIAMMKYSFRGVISLSGLFHTYKF